MNTMQNLEELKRHNAMLELVIERCAETIRKLQIERDGSARTCASLRKAFAEYGVLRRLQGRPVATKADGKAGMDETQEGCP